LLEKTDHLARHAGKRIELVRVVDKDTTSRRNITLPAGLLSDDLDALVDDPEVSVVVQLIGGAGVSRDIMLRLLESGKDVVTANKALLAHHGPELFAKARELGRTIAFEAAVGGGMPVIAGIGQSLAANQIESLSAILNGTTNFILSEMGTKGNSYDEAVKEAQRLGFAEADPTLDVNGTDAAQKLAILSQLAFGADADWAQIPRLGVDLLDVADLDNARDMGCTVKLIAQATRTPKGLNLHVAPTLVKLGSPMADVNEAFNAVEVVGDFVGRSFFCGLGAGQEPTASAVVADVLDMVAGRAPITFRNLALWSSDREPPIAACPPETVPGQFYLRFEVDASTVDETITQVTELFAKQDVPLSSVDRHNPPAVASDQASLVVLTKATTEGAITQAIDALAAASIPQGKVVRMRIEG
jgi:homoserine dehydrogenase